MTDQSLPLISVGAIRWDGASQLAVDRGSRGVLACPSRAIQGLGSVHRQRGYGVVWQPGDTSEAVGVESRQASYPDFFFYYLTFLFLGSVSRIMYRNMIADPMLT